jgi:peptide/nickel transport system permease protein
MRSSTLNASVPMFSGAVLLALVVGLALAAPAICPAGPLARVSTALQPPSSEWLAGTDDIGRSVSCMTLYGLRTSLIVGVGAGLLALSVGTIAGVMAGLIVGWTDLLLMRLAEIAQAMPRLFLAILAAALFELRILGLVLVLGLTSWGMLARFVRAEAMTLSTRDFVMAARALGASTPRLVLRHFIPNLRRPLLSTAGPMVASAILGEAALSYVGLGDPDNVSLGRLIAAAYPFMEVAWWMSVAPIGSLVVVTLAFMLLVEARDAE